MDESLVGSPGFKPVCEALTLSRVGSIPTRLRQLRAGAWGKPGFARSLAVRRSCSSRALMAENRGRDRVPLTGEGAGKIAGSGKRFEFRVLDFSIEGILLQVVKGTVPGIGEQVGLALRADRLDDAPTRFTLTATVKRHQKRRNRIFCGVEVVTVKGENAREAMNHAYLEQFFSRF